MRPGSFQTVTEWGCLMCHPLLRPILAVVNAPKPSLTPGERYCEGTAVQQDNVRTVWLWQFALVYVINVENKLTSDMAVHKLCLPVLKLSANQGRS